MRSVSGGDRRVDGAGSEEDSSETRHDRAGNGGRRVGKGEEMEGTRKRGRQTKLLIVCEFRGKDFAG
jgi:hypothetical protein